MDALEKLAARQHLAVALLSAWLIATSPWIEMLRRVPREAGFLDYSHVVLGFVTLAIAITYTVTCNVTPADCCAAASRPPRVADCSV